MNKTIRISQNPWDNYVAYDGYDKISDGATLEMVVSHACKLFQNDRIHFFGFMGDEANAYLKEMEVTA